MPLLALSPSDRISGCLDIVSGTTPKLSAEGINAIQEIVGMLNWYSRATDPTMARKLRSSIEARQAKATTKVREEVKQFLDYCVGHPNATVRFLASDMILALHSGRCILSIRARIQK